MKEENVSLLSRFSGLFVKKPIAPIEAVKAGYNADSAKVWTWKRHKSDVLRYQSEIYLESEYLLKEKKRFLSYFVDHC